MTPADQTERMRHGKGFVAALDQSGGSTPKALKLYGIDEAQWSSDTEMFDLVHAMRARIMTSPVFTRDRILAAILFVQTMDRQVDGLDTPAYLATKGIASILKVDKGLAPPDDGSQLMKPIPDLDEVCERAVAKGVFGTKMRSVIKQNSGAIEAVVLQQFDLARQILGHGLVPIIEPEIDIHSPDKADCEDVLKTQLASQLDALPGDTQVMLKLTIPSEAGFYSDLIAHPRVLRVVALSGGYSRDDANRLLAKNPGLIASFSRALTEGLTVQQTDDEFNQALDASIQAIHDASVT